MVNAHLVDGTYELFRAYFSAPKASVRGSEVGATRGFASSMLTLLKAPDVTHVGCAFDHTITSFRNALFADYKDGEGLEEDILSQFELVEEVSRALGLVTWPMVEFEADDALATAAILYKEHAQRVYLTTPDKDLCQMVEADRVVLWDRRRERTFDRQAVIDKFGVPPESIPDYLGLVGDAADGIPGVPRWGAKSSALLLAAYGHLESIPSDVEHWTVKPRGAKALSDSLESHRDQAYLYRTLATLRTDAPLHESFDELKWLGPDREALQEVAARIGSRSLEDRTMRVAEAKLG